jgi:hypothetical protein
MWILLIIILNSGQVMEPVKEVKIMGGYFLASDCHAARARAVSLDPPQNTSLGCLYIEGVSLAKV